MEDAKNMRNYVAFQDVAQIMIDQMLIAIEN